MAIIYIRWLLDVRELAITMPCAGQETVMKWEMAWPIDGHVMAMENQEHGHDMGGHYMLMTRSRTSK
eukprot:1617655-Lingulodinium_polyedra.AAC.1